MPALLELDQTRRDRETANARLGEAGARQWRRAWLGAYLQCLGLMLAGYAIYGYSWGLERDAALLASALGMVVAYALPFFRLIVFFIKHSDQF